MMIHKDHPLASVRDSFNAVFVHGDAADDAMFYGRVQESSQQPVQLWEM